MLENFDVEETKIGFKNRTMTIRFRAWSITALIIFGFIIYTFISPFFGGEPDYVSLIFMAVIQIVVHLVYFPEGERFGGRDKTYSENKKAYNDKANKINADKRIKDLREYCKIDFEQRKKDYVETELGAIGITEEEFNELKKYSQKEIIKLDKFEFGGNVYHFTKASRKRLFALIFLPLPVEENDSGTILNGIENKKGKRIKDKSIAYKDIRLMLRFAKAVPVAIFLGYLGVELKDGIDLNSIIKIFYLIASIITVAIMSFISGEKCVKVFKNEFYIELSTFIDSFNEWCNNKVS